MTTIFDQAMGLLKADRASEALSLFARYPDELGDPDSLSLRALVLSRLGRHDEALSTANRVYATSPSGKAKAVLHDVYDAYRKAPEARAPLAAVPPATLQRPGLIVFSKDRPMQLDALLTSLAELSDLDAAGPVRVIMRASAEAFARGYALVKERHAAVDMIVEREFDRDLRAALADLDAVAFFVDDAIVHRRFSWRQVLGRLGAASDAVGFSLRLGTNICRSISSTRPPFAWPDVTLAASGEDAAQDVLGLAWAGSAQRDLNTPLEVSSSVFRQELIMRLLRDIHICNPNTLEMTLECQKRRVEGWPLLLFRESVSYCLPINMVQSVVDNRTIHDANFSADKLAEHYLAGFRIDLESFRFYRPQATHEYFFPKLTRTAGRRTAAPR